MGSLNKISLVVLTAMLATTAAGQQLSGFAGMMNAGLISTQPLPSSLEGIDSVKLGTLYTLVGIEGYYRNGRAIMSLSGYLGIQGSRQARVSFLESSLWSAHAGFGWILSNNSNFCIYPAIGLGMNGSSLVEYRRHPDEDVEVIHTNSPSTDLSLHFDYLMTDEHPDGNHVNGIILGIKAGYNVGFKPSSRLQGWYVTVSVGGLAFMKKKS